jgi:D-glycero-D-manno-heptose 1,7-bisphosphate phosphatase
MAIKIWQDLGLPIYILTNQSGLSRGFFTQNDLELIHSQMQNDLIDVGLKPFNGFLVCPHQPDDHCECRKPLPKLALELIKELGIDPKESLMIGDKDIDAQTGINLGGEGIIIRTTQKSSYQTFPDLISIARLMKNK